MADKFEKYQAKTKSGENAAAVMDSLGITRYCCRRMMLTSVETIQQIVPFYEATHKRRLKVESEME